jgi:redox-sensitive bicupin YhaK (pirin superfamily)
MMMLVQRASDRLEFGHGGFQVRRVLPGLSLQNANDPGFGPLGAFDHARLQPGVVVAMHLHRNDEIFSYMREGTMLHEDTSGARLPLTPTHFAAMNAGSGIRHEERVPDDGEPVEMLQVFVRPREDELPPNFQHRGFPQTESLNAWRLLAGPEQSNAPFTLRNAVWIHDAHLERASLQTPSAAGLDGHLYVFRGEVSAGGQALNAGDSLLILGEEEVDVQTASSADLVLFQINRAAPASRSGTLSG